MADVLFTRRGKRDVKRLDPPVRRRILKRLQDFAADPLTPAKKLTDSRIGTFRYRIGDYRVIFDFIDGQVVVLRVGDRKEIYS